MFPTSEELAPFTTMDQGVDIRYDNGPIESLPICFSHKHACAYMTSTDP
jgi:hypothetical protein